MILFSNSLKSHLMLSMFDSFHFVPVHTCSLKLVHKFLIFCAFFFMNLNTPHGVLHCAKQLDFSVVF